MELSVYSPLSAKEPYARSVTNEKLLEIGGLKQSLTEVPGE